MGLAPKIKKAPLLLTCTQCGRTRDVSCFTPTTSPFFQGYLTVCNNCIDDLISQNNGDWNYVDKLCQMINIPFVPSEWVHMYETNPIEAFCRYAAIFLSSEYAGLDWKTYQDAYVELQKRNQLEEEIPGLAEERRDQLKEMWGGGYDNEALEYLDKLYKGLLNTQNVNGSLSHDQAQKICKISYEIDRRIESGQEFDKLLTSYDKLVKTGEFTPKNVKNVNDFDTFGEAVKWMEKNGWKNEFYDNVTRDIVDETIQNYQSFVQRLYINESSIGDQITSRLEALRKVNEMEKTVNYYNTDQNYDLDAYENTGYEQLQTTEEQDFKVDLEDEE